MPCSSWSEQSGEATPSFFSVCRNSTVDRQVPMIEQCRLLLNSHIFVRRGGAVGKGGASRATSRGGMEEMSKILDSAGEPTPLLIAIGGPPVSIFIVVPVSRYPPTGTKALVVICNWI